MIKYNIETEDLQIIKEPEVELNLTVSGWFFSDIISDPDITIQTDLPHRIRLYERPDVREQYQTELKSKFCGFTIDVVLNRFIPFLTIQFEENHNRMVHTHYLDKKKCRFDIAYLKFFGSNRLKSQMKKQMISYNHLLGGGIHEILQYHIDEIVYVNKYSVAVVSGWKWSKNAACKVSFGECDIVSEMKQKRPDVLSYLHVQETEEPNGFEYRAFIGDHSFVTVDFFCEKSGRIKVMIPVRAVDGSIYDSSMLLSAQEQNSYIKKYGKKGIPFKLRERELYFQESIANDRGYQRKQYQKMELTQEKINLCIVLAVNSDLWARKINERSIFVKNGLQMICCCHKKMIEQIKLEGGIQIVASEKTEKEDLLFEGFKHADRDYILFMDQEDSFEDTFLDDFISRQENSFDYIYYDYDLEYENQGMIKVERTQQIFDKENDSLVLTACIFNASLTRRCKSLADIRNILHQCSNYHHETRVWFHYNMVEDTWKKNAGKPIAFYLTQYHITEENNRWWGDGFTEWVNVKRAYPMFEEHDQPRVPTEFGYYDLVEDQTVQYRQIAMAKEYGIYGFCYYYYWFEKKRLLRKPLDQFLKNKDLDFPYCICWANETWSKRWDGLEHEILMKQVHNEQTDAEFIYDIIPMFEDVRYIQIDGKPLLLIYRMELFPYPNQTIERWRKICREEGIGEIHIAVVQSFEMVDHRMYGADSSVEFPPHKISTIPNINITDTINVSEKQFHGSIYDYQKVVNQMSTIQRREYELYPGSMLRWDNTARKLQNAHMFANFSPALYRQWLIKNMHYTKMYNKEPILFINAWNEWAEGSYLEPDATYGDEMLQITREVSVMK